MMTSVEKHDRIDPIESRESNEGSKFSNRCSNQPPIKLGLSGCHDSTIAAILTGLGAFKLEWWPPYTSHIALSFSRKQRFPRYWLL